MYFRKIRLRRDLNKLFKSLDDRYWINSGGCCFIACQVAKHLDRLGIKYELMVISSDGLIFNDAYSNIKNRNLNGNPCGNNTQYHYYIRIPYVGSINVGWIPKNTKTTCVKNLTFEDIKWIYNTGDWNSEYDISNNKMIVNEINSIFKKYENI